VTYLVKRIQKFCGFFISNFVETRKHRDAFNDVVLKLALNGSETEVRNAIVNATTLCFGVEG